MLMHFCATFINISIDMGLVRFVGKLLIVASIVFQAYLLYQDKKEGDEFNRNLKNAMVNCQCLQSIRHLLEQHLRLAVAGLLASSVFLLVLKKWFFKLLPLTGLFLLLFVEHHGVFHQVPTLALLDNACFWHSLGVIGAILYLMADECKGCKGKKGKEAPKGEKEAEKTSSAPAPQGGKKGKGKKE